MTSSLANPTTKAEAAPNLTLRILTINVHKGFGWFNRRFVLPELRAAVRTTGADVVFLQEVLGAHARHSMRHGSRWPSAPQYEFLADTIWTQYAYGRNAAYPDGHHGNAVLSKFPIVHHRNLDVSVAGPEKRGLLHCVLELPNAKRHVHAICVHLGLKESHRRRQVAMLSELVASLPSDAPVIVAGDFNDWRLRAQETLHRDVGLREVFAQAQGVSARTFPARWPLLRLDRIYVRGAEAYRPAPLPSRPWAHLSDHAPLVAEIDL